MILCTLDAYIGDVHELGVRHSGNPTIGSARRDRVCGVPARATAPKLKLSSFQKPEPVRELPQVQSLTSLALNSSSHSDSVSEAGPPHLQQACDDPSTLAVQHFSHSASRYRHSFSHSHFRDFAAHRHGHLIPRHRSACLATTPVHLLGGTHSDDLLAEPGVRRIRRILPSSSSRFRPLHQLLSADSILIRPSLRNLSIHPHLEQVVHLRRLGTLFGHLLHFLIRCKLSHVVRDQLASPPPASIRLVVRNGARRLPRDVRGPAVLHLPAVAPAPLLAAKWVAL